MPATSPMKMELIGETNPAAGVIATNPATAPEQKPRSVGLLVQIHSTNIQLMAAVAVAVLVFKRATAARALAERADPPLKPNQPNPE